MRDNPYNQLTPAQVERLTYFVEEVGGTTERLADALSILSKALKATSKLVRHGAQDTVCLDEEGNQVTYDNKFDLSVECGHVLFAIDMLKYNKDIDPKVMAEAKEYKAKTAGRYFHHQKGEHYVKRPEDVD